MGLFAAAAFCCTFAAREAFAQAPAGSAAPGQFGGASAPGQFGGATPPGQFAPGQLGADPAPPPGGGTPPPGAAATPQPSPFGNMGAGGLTPPPPSSSDPPPAGPAEPELGATDTNSFLDESKREDSGRGLTWVWIEVGGGFEHVGLQTFNADEETLTAGFVATSSSGGVVDGGLGVRLLFVTLGARARMGFFEDWQLGRIGGELGFRIPIGRVEPRIDLGAGYAALGSLGGAIGGEEVDASVTGYYARIGGGLDVFPVNAVSIGAGVSWEFLGLTRPGLSPSEIASLEGEAQADPEGSRATILAADGSGYGSSVSITARVGVHF
jgi:hypothetical protein